MKIVIDTNIIFSAILNTNGTIEQKETGSHEVVFDGKDLPSGIYYYSLIVNNESVSTKKMILLK